MVSMGPGRHFTFCVIVIVYVLPVETQEESCTTPHGRDGICVNIRLCRSILYLIRYLAAPASDNVSEQLRPYQCGWDDQRPKVCCPRGDAEATEGPEAKACKTPDSANGYCINMFSCKPMRYVFEYLPQPLTKQVADRLKSYLCGFEGRVPKVCCPFDYFYIDTPDPVPPDVSEHENVGLLNQDCGKRGFFAFPWMALLSYKTDNGSEFKCGGSILNNRYILTSADCIKPTLPLLGVRVGERNFSTTIDCQTIMGDHEVCVTHQDLRIEEVISHPQFGKVGYDNDIGLLRVERMNISQNVRPICLPTGNLTADNLIGKFLTVTGLGSTGTDANSTLVLSKLSLPLVTLKECRKSYATLSPISKRQICAGGLDGKDFCSGDGGGALQYLATVGSSRRYVQYGIISYGPVVCGVGGWPSVYTKVEKYIGWILDNMEPEREFDMDVR